MVQFFAVPDSFAFIGNKKSIFLLNVHRCIIEDQHVSNELVNILLSFSKASQKALYSTILCTLKQRLEVDIQIDSILVNPKKLSTTGESINLCSNNIRKSVWIKKAVSGSNHYGNLKYDETAGIQCTITALIAVCFSAVKNISVWKSWNLDFILNQGDIFMTS